MVTQYEPAIVDYLNSICGLYRRQTITERHYFINNNAAHGAAQSPGATARAVAPVNERRMAMSGKMDQVKGRIKEAAGVLTDDDRLKREGKLDQVVGKVKETAAKAVDTMKDALTSKRLRRPAK